MIKRVGHPYVSMTNTVLSLWLVIKENLLSLSVTLLICQTIINDAEMIELKDHDPRMIANNLKSSEPVHPGLLLKEEIEYRGITQKVLAKQMGVSYTVLNEILNGKRPISVEYALYLEAVLGIDAQLWIQMQADYNLQVAKSDKTIRRRIKEIRKMVAAL